MRLGYRRTYKYARLDFLSSLVCNIFLKYLRNSAVVRLCSLFVLQSIFLGFVQEPLGSAEVINASLWQSRNQCYLRSFRLVEIFFPATSLLSGIRGMWLLVGLNYHSHIIETLRRVLVFFCIKKFFVLLLT
jgi:hypothetical protein